MTRFSVYKHQFELPSGTIARRQLIVLKDDDGLLTFTDFGKYITRKAKESSPTNDGGMQFYFIAKMLNYALHECGIRKLDDLTVDMVQDFLQNYAQGTLDGDTQPRKPATVGACINAVMNFLLNYVKDSKNSSIKEKDLYRKELYTDKHNNLCKRKVPVFDVICEASNKTIYRELPDKAFVLLINHIAEAHPELLGLVLLCAFAGLRPAEACNVRREDSPLGPGIMISTVDGEVVEIRIDIMQSRIIRSDDKLTGGIKKPREQVVPIVFIDAFMEYYNVYLKYLKTREYEEEYGPLNINRQGKAIIYRSFYGSFKKIIKEEMIPIYQQSQDPDLVEYAQILMEHNLAPHVLRHWYTVQLVLAGYGVNELADARGDKSLESATWYLQNKGELVRKFKNTADEYFNYMSWAAEKSHAVK